MEMGEQTKYTIVFLLSQTRILELEEVRYKWWEERKINSASGIWFMEWIGFKNCQHWMNDRMLTK